MPASGTLLAYSPPCDQRRLFSICYPPHVPPHFVVDCATPAQVRPPPHHLYTIDLQHLYTCNTHCTSI